MRADNFGSYEPNVLYFHTLGLHSTQTVEQQQLQAVCTKKREKGNGNSFVLNSRDNAQLFLELGVRLVNLNIFPARIHSFERNATDHSCPC